MKRYATVEGQFYPNSKELIFSFIKEIELQSSKDDIPEKAMTTIGAILPHAGHVYSAYQTIPFFKYLIKYDIQVETFIILNPNHSGVGPDIALDPNTSWINCIGELELDQEIKELLPYPAEGIAQDNEHSAEVLIPFMQYYFRDRSFKILPISINRISSDQAKKLAKNLHQAIRSTGRSSMIIASSDFSHFLSPEAGRKKDDLVLAAIENQDIRGLEKTVVRNNITVCGYRPIMTLMAYSDVLAEEYSTTMLARGHSGEVVPSGKVVDYISILFHSKE